MDWTLKLRSAKSSTGRVFAIQTTACGGNSVDPVSSVKLGCRKNLFRLGKKELNHEKTSGARVSIKRKTT